MWRLSKAGQLLVPAEQLATGTVIAQAASERAARCGVVRQSFLGGQKADLQRQLPGLAEFSAKHGFPVAEAVRKTGSGLNGHRKAFCESCAIRKYRSLWLSTATG